MTKITCCKVMVWIVLLLALFQWYNDGQYYEIISEVMTALTWGIISLLLPMAMTYTLLALAISQIIYRQASAHTTTIGEFATYLLILYSLITLWLRKQKKQ